MTKLYNGNGPFKNFLVKYARSFDHPFKLRIINKLIALLYPHGIPLKGAFGEIIYANPKDYIGHHLIYAGSFEPVSLQLTLKLLNNIHQPVFIDIGANIGLYTISSSKVAGIKVYAIEPTAKNFWKLQQNISLNSGLTSNLHLLNIALSYETNFCYLFNPIDGNDGTFRVEHSANSKSYAISTATFDSVLLYNAITHIDVIKMDVEGYEGKILKGFKLIEEIRPKHIIMEFTDYVERVGDSRVEIYNDLIQLGYEALNVYEKPVAIMDPLPEDNIWFRLK